MSIDQLTAMISKADPHDGQQVKQHALYVQITPRTSTLWAAALGREGSMLGAAVTLERVVDMGVEGIMLRAWKHSHKPVNEAGPVRFSPETTGDNVRVMITEKTHGADFVATLPPFGRGAVECRITNTGGLFVPLVPEQHRVPPRQLHRRRVQGGYTAPEGERPAAPTNGSKHELSEAELTMQIRAAKAAGARYIILAGGTKVPLI